MEGYSCDGFLDGTPGSILGGEGVTKIKTWIQAKKLVREMSYEDSLPPSLSITIA